MAAKKPIENRLEKLGREIGSDESLVQNVMGRIDSIKIDQKQFTEFKSRTLLRRFIMNPLTRLAAAAVIIIAGVLSITFLHKSVAPAYALEQTIQSYQGMRYLHTKFLCCENDAVAKEFWFEFDESGRIKKMRINHSEWFGGDVYVWTENETKSWDPKRNSLMIFNDEIYTSRVLGMDEVKGPRLIVEHLYDQEAKGLVGIEIDETSNKAEPIVLTATYLTEGDRFCDRRVLFIDKSTKFVTKIEYYVFKEGKYNYDHATEYYNYNVPIDANMFNLADEILPNTHIIDTRTQDIGLAQGNLTDEEIPIKVVREFIEALIAKDYAKAGQIYGGRPPAEFEQDWARQVIRLISVGPVVQPEKLHKIHPDRVLVPCTIEIEKDGQISRQTHEFFVATVVGRRDRWEIQSSKSLK